MSEADKQYNNLDVSNILTSPLSGLTDSTNYYYRVRAVNSSYGVRSPYSNEALVIVPVSKSAVSSRKKK